MRSVFWWIAHALRAGEHGRVVRHDDGARALGAEHRRVDAADARDHAVGGRVADQVVEGAARLLRGERQCSVLDEAAGVAQVGEVLARRAQAERVPLRDRFGACIVARERFASLQLQQVVAEGGCGRGCGCRCGCGRGCRRARRRGGRKASCARRLGVGAPLQAEQHLALDDDVAGAHPHRGDLAVALGAHLVLHLHRLDDRQHRAGANAPARLDGDGDDAAGERGADVHRGSGGRACVEASPQRTAPG
jgi:hypothetical protein